MGKDCLLADDGGMEKRVRSACRWRNWLKQFSRLPARTSSWRMSIRDIRVTTPRMPPRNTACGWRWSNIQRPNADTCRCRAAGWWKEALPGRPASAAWLEIMNGLARPSPAFTSSRGVLFLAGLGFGEATFFAGSVMLQSSHRHPK